jgi:hypothetical protein
MYIDEKKREAASKAADDMAAAVKAGKSFEQAAAEFKLQVLPTLTTTRFQANGKVDPGLLQGGFDAKLGDVAVVPGSDRVPWVVRVDKIEPVTPEAAAALRAQVAPQVNQTLQQDLREVFVGGLEKEVEIKTDETAIKQYFDSFIQSDQ